MQATPTSTTPIRAMLNIELVRPADSPSAEALAKADQPFLDFLASTGAIDRYREIIEPDGWRLDAYRRNPVFQNAHRYGDILFTLGKALITEVRDLGEGRRALFQRIAFAVDVNPVARIAHGLYQGGFLRAVSVGFIPLRWEEGNAQSSYSRRYLEQELLEVSAVAVPANADALALGLKAGAIAKDDLKELLDLISPFCTNPGDSQTTTLSSQLVSARSLREALKR